MAEAAITIVKPAIVQRITEEQKDLIKSTIAKGATDDELRLFLYQCDRTGLDPLARQIYMVKRWDNVQKRQVMAIQVSIDGFRLIAERSGKYAGQTGPFWCDKDGRWLDVWVYPEPPAAAKVGALRSDFKEPCWGVARFDTYAQRTKEGEVTRIWRNMSDLMIAKCAEALALRKAFPQELSGLYTQEEMEQASEAVEVEPPTPQESQVKPQPVDGLKSDQVPLKADGKPDWKVFCSSLLADVRACKLDNQITEALRIHTANLKQLKKMAPGLYSSLERGVSKARADLIPDEEVEEGREG